MLKLLLTLLFFEVPLTAAGGGAEAGVSWEEGNLSGSVPAAPVVSAFTSPGGPVTSPALKLPLNGYVSVWSQDCSSGPCAIPLPLVKNRPIVFELALPQAPGQAQPGTVKEVFGLPEAGELLLTLNFYAVCPYAAAKSSVADSAIGPRQASVTVADSAIGPRQASVTGTCPALYFQAQAELAGAAGAFCAAAFNEKDFFPFPVLMCGGSKTRGVRFGITLHRAKL
ncbi:MAG: hypothetical protein NTX59_00140 [Elusimicrobia bacterium]|nr:hypothetical protein [Elusimicrobiota bacterium]